ncbi:undecaprenyl-phosphate glucose phosphotransferase [Flavobacterium sp. PL002]|uniref:undecaprenyl-phosphate glucose phosphotransferase n=1 Tax=Flavobacterium sp. PL002 TaxID=1897058 RepID=UPI001787F5F7|nr:undecaprenyl-phosphate glucose phosphotransferase [Flavobacterium sp. PL002]MBE0392514.1 UDP-glucose:undecaprenyl-phosphate glucose-1-phosphate transferase [Flavobacterium sp. PL002]
MIKPPITRYSKYLRPISAVTDLIVIAFFVILLFDDSNLNKGYFLLYQLTGWLIIALLTKFYDVYRFTKPIAIVSKITKQSLLFFLVVIAFFPISNSAIFKGNITILFFVLTTSFVTLFKFLLFYYLKKYRIHTGSNYRNVIIIGYTEEALRLKALFENKIEFGYRFSGYFSDKKDADAIIGKVTDIKKFVIENEVNEIYCSLKELSNEQLKGLIEFADENHKNIKFIPDSKEIFSKNLKIDYYDFFPVLSLKQTRLDEPIIKLLKRIFDIVFSLIVIIGLLSWLVPLLAILIKLESKGPVFFKQGRPGINENEFNCYKFRSMKTNNDSEIETIKNDPRVTKLGRIMRKTSLDETPQFLNVLIGDMSVVGPRPHLWSQNKIYGNKIKKYMNRHYVKPGITGLAQVSGFRGSIEKDIDMINRIKLDVFYIENWSFLLDLKIIFQTVVNICKGEEKAF